MPDSLFQIEVVSPARPLFKGEAGSVVAEAYDGEIGVLPGHAPLVTMLGTGVVTVKYAGLRKGEERFAVRGGFLQVLGRKVTLLVTEARRAEDVDAPKVKAALDGVMETLHHPPSDAEYERLLDERRWLQSQLKIAAK